MRTLLFAALLLCGGVAAADLPGNSASGWHRWQIDNKHETTVYVRLQDGRPTRIRTHDGDCIRPPKGEVTDHGLVAASESYLWFRQFVEMRELDKHMREAALFGIAQSDSDQAYDYLDSLISGGQPRM
ncbi:MAG: hypothetical protein K0U72_12530 [Gammaproteobacteria bacterium]|nr:hypothetical protein [Gammaproteobacteria bacterium]